MLPENGLSHDIAQVLTGYIQRFKDLEPYRTWDQFELFEEKVVNATTKWLPCNMSIRVANLQAWLGNLLEV